MNVYVIGLILIIVGAFFLRDENQKNRKLYIILCAVYLGAILILRTPEVGSDIGRYRTHFLTCGLLSPREIFANYDNTGFYLYNHYMYLILGGNYQAYLVITGMLTFCPVVWLIWNYSEKPYYSFLAYFCMGYYVFQFTGLKQAVAMGILCFAFHFAMQNKPIQFYITVAIASFVHVPALIFALVYLLSRFKFTKYHIFGYIIAFGLIWLFKDRIVIFLSDQYDSAVETEALAGVGGKVFLIALIALFGVLVRKVSNDDVLYRMLLQLMVVAAIIQTFAMYGNVFERLADYYFFYIILFVPCIMGKKYRDGDMATLKTTGVDRLFYVIALTGAFVLYYLKFGLNTPGLLPYSTWL